MYESHRKRNVVAITGMLLATVVLSARLIAGQHAHQNLSNSNQPKISWSQDQLVVVLSAGQSITRSITFTSSLPLQDAVVEPVPQVAGFINIQPPSFSLVPSMQPQTLQLSFATPTGTALGALEGTVHVRTRNQTLPQTLKVVIHVVSYASPSLGIGFNMPSFSTPTNVVVSQGPTGTSHIDVELQNTASAGFLPAFRMTVYDNPSGVDLNRWFQENIDVNGTLAASNTFQQQKLQNGLVALIRSSPVPPAYLDVSGPVEEAFLMSPAQDHVVSVIQSQDNDLQSLGYSQDAIKNLLIGVLGTVDFSQ